jgi:CheY-like chemotaxis protein
MQTITKNVTLKLNELAGKRVCVVGFQSKDADTIREALESGEAFCRVMPPNKDEAGLSAFDLAVVQIDEPAIRTWLSSVRGAGEVPVLLIGNLETFFTEMPGLLTGSTDFLVGENLSSTELLLRTLKLIQKGGVKAAAKRAQPLVLLVDDDKNVVSLLSKVLANAGMECHSAREGNTGIQMAKQLKPDLMIVDVNMPNRDGFDVLRALKQSPDTASIRVLLLTGCEQESDVLRGFGLGASDYVIKPFNPMEIRARVQSLLARPQ